MQPSAIGFATVMVDEQAMNTHCYYFKILCEKDIKKLLRKNCLSQKVKLRETIVIQLFPGMNTEYYNNLLVFVRYDWIAHTKDIYYWIKLLKYMK
jgi:hypothetical protein